VFIYVHIYDICMCWTEGRFWYMITRIKIEFSCRYLPQGHHFISVLWLRSTDEYLYFWFWAKPLTICLLVQKS